jgi:hypothetical protein
METKQETSMGRLVQATFEDMIETIGTLRPKLIFTSPPFDVKMQQLDLWFGQIGKLVPEGGSLVVHHGNSWEPPHASLKTMEQLYAIAKCSGLDLHQTFVVLHERERLSPSVAGVLDSIAHVPDLHSHAWWLGRNARPTLFPTASSIIYAGSDRAWERRLIVGDYVPYHAALSRTVPGFFIDLLTDADDLVLDPFAGTNSTGEAAEHAGRKWLSIEPDDNQIEQAMYRLPASERLPS